MSFKQAAGGGAAGLILFARLCLGYGAQFLFRFFAGAHPVQGAALAHFFVRPVGHLVPAPIGPVLAFVPLRLFVALDLRIGHQCLACIAGDEAMDAVECGGLPSGWVEQQGVGQIDYLFSCQRGVHG